MAESPAHKFGQIIGDALEESIAPILENFAREHGLYFDKKGPRKARKGLKVSWTDLNGNDHDLDFVLERGGTENRKGIPVAFIEAAWRRYTKHSRNKAQEIQGALIPLLSTYQNADPFIGTIVAGDWTKGAIKQLQSLGFNVLYFPLDTVVTAFKQVGIDAKSEEDTPDAEFEDMVQQWDALTKENQLSMSIALQEVNSNEIESFMQALHRHVIREIVSIRILPLHGVVCQLDSIEDAIGFIEGYNESSIPHPIVKYEIMINYNNGDSIQGNFSNKDSAIQFLQTYLPPKQGIT